MGASHIERLSSMMNAADVRSKAAEARAEEAKALVQKTEARAEEAEASLRQAILQILELRQIPLDDDLRQILSHRITGDKLAQIFQSLVQVTSVDALRRLLNRDA